ncbi:hypothetical protein QT196_02005 [Streptomyces sp. P9-2B-2]|uniref:hypothetical protein n=1 Tax=Streptomyces TaxID=1883 RepID=UPI002259A747|nr:MULTISPECIES: hypothetical protein [Streptomyces]MCX4637728.1 hypothetical protein [Streptomyces platensis]WJY43141.1 hypothetical protein QT196_02005 [Streptomyces sp. P9-2B-2]
MITPATTRSSHCDRFAQPGDLLELSTELGTQILRLTHVERRTQGIKFMGRNHQEALYSSGMKYGELARCFRP